MICRVDMHNSLHHARSTMRVVYSCDIGSTRKQPSNFGWARAESSVPKKFVGSRCIDLLVRNIASDAAKGNSIAIGFEAPAFLPVPHDPLNLSRSRDQE